MSYKEKRTITMMGTGVLVIAAYCIYTLGKYQSGAVTPDDLRFWASAMLVFIGIGIAANILIQIIFHILLSISIAVREKIQDQESDDKDIEKAIGAEMIEDEMDKLIELKSARIGFIFAGVGFVSALISVMLSYPPFVMLNIMFISFFAGSIFEGIAQLYYYRKGIHND